MPQSPTPRSIASWISPEARVRVPLSAHSSTTSPGWASAAYVLCLQSCLGFAYYGATANLVLLLQDYAGQTERRAESLTNYFGAVVGLTPLLGGFLSDRILGGFRTIMLGGVIFALSLVSITAAVHLRADWLLMPALFIILPLGYGLLTATVSVFGAQQFGKTGETTSWFSWLYFSTNIGSMLAFLIPGMIQQNISFTVGLAVPSVVLVLGLTVFGCAHSKFVHPTSSKEPSVEGSDLEALKAGPDATQIWRKILPAMLLTVVFSIGYCQMQTTWYVQGLWMNRSMFGVEIPVAYMMCADPLFVMLCIYFVESWAFPRLRSMGKMPSPVSRMGLGMIFACCGMLSAYHVERIRLDAVRGGNLAQPSSVSIMMQVPQFAFVAVAEVFVYTTIQDYAFSLAPASMKSSINGLNIFCGSIANVIAGVMTTACSLWIPPSNPNYGHYDRFYLLLGVMCFFGGLGFYALRDASQPVVGKKAAYGAA